MADRPDRLTVADPVACVIRVGGAVPPPGSDSPGRVCITGAAGGGSPAGPGGEGGKRGNPGDQAVPRRAFRARFAATFWAARCAWYAAHVPADAAGGAAVFGRPVRSARAFHASGHRQSWASRPCS